VQLTRDYEILKQNYDSLLGKRQDSRMAANLERRQIGEQFRILDPASLPERPDQELRRLAMVFSPAFAGVLLGLAIATFLEYRDSTFRSHADVEQILNLPVLAVVPSMLVDAERRRRRFRLIIGDIAVGTAVCSAAVAAFVWVVLKS
jgi:hypothetical protein